MKPVLYLSAGHSCTVYDSVTKEKKLKQPDRGVYAILDNIEYAEGDLTADLRKALVTAFLKENIKVIVDDDKSILKQTLSFFKPLIADYNDIAIDLHFNASLSKTATGVEVLVPNKPTEFELHFGRDLSKIISDSLYIRDRGVKTEANSHHKKLGWMNLPCENFIIEVCFITNKFDVKQYIDNKEKLVSNIVQFSKYYFK